MNVVIIGASNKIDRYSYKALMLLGEYGHQVFPVHKKLKDIEGIKVFSSIAEIAMSIDTVTMYVGSAISNVLKDEILSSNPKRIIFNPGAENLTLEQEAQAKGIKTINACTLVMLKTGQF